MLARQLRAPEKQREEVSVASEEELIRARRAKFEKLEQAGTKAFPNTFRADETRRKPLAAR